MVMTELDGNLRAMLGFSFSWATGYLEARRNVNGKADLERAVAYESQRVAAAGLSSWQDRWTPPERDWLKLNMVVAVLSDVSELC